MHRSRRVSPAGRSIAAIGAAMAIAIGLGLGGAPRPASAAGLSRWDGSIDVFRSSAFTTQKTWLWCTAADVQIIRNIVAGEDDHSRSNQERYFAAMRAHNRYAIPVADGVDPAGWTFGLREFVDDRYRLVASRGFDAALRSAVTSLRRTNLPVGLTVAHGNHAWVLTGFSATADPAVTTRFSVTSVRVVGPLWGLQSRRYGYDMRPGATLTPRQLAGFFTRWHYAGIRMAWEGRWVSIQPIGRMPATAGPSAPAAPTAPAPSAPAPSSVPPSPTTARSPSAASSPGPSQTPAPSRPEDVAVAGSSGPDGVAGRGPGPSDLGFAGTVAPLGIAAAVVVAVVAIGGLRARSARRRARGGDARR
jgi:hypothetical protein